MQIEHAVREPIDLRMLIYGASGSGKSYTAVGLATYIAGDAGVVVIDTERRRSLLYADRFEFQVIHVDDHKPATLLAAIRTAEKANPGCIVIDSLTPVWEWSLNENDRVARERYNGNTFAAWGVTGQDWNDLMASLLATNTHVIVTARAKEKYEPKKNDRGKVEPVSLGVLPILRKGSEYEFDIVCMMDIEHSLFVTASRFSKIANTVLRQPGQKFASEIAGWLAGGDDSSQPANGDPAAVDELPPDFDEGDHLARPSVFSGGKS